METTHTQSTPETTVEFWGHKAVPRGVYVLQPDEMMFYLYLPIKLDCSNIIEVPPNLNQYVPMIHAAMQDYQGDIRDSHRNDIFERYVYITAKTLFVTPDNIGNRPGYHCDGWNTDDINYIWCDKYPTVFNDGHFIVRQDDLLSLLDLDSQVRVEHEYSFNVNTLTRIDSLTPHRTPTITESGVRTFVKISISKHRYNLKGNSHNYGLSYDWAMFSRSDVRNMENKDFFTPMS